MKLLLLKLKYLTLVTEVHPTTARNAKETSWRLMTFAIPEIDNYYNLSSILYRRSSSRKNDRIIIESEPPPRVLQPEVKYFRVGTIKITSY